MGTKNAYNREHFVTVQMGTHLATVWLHQVEVLSAAIGDGGPYFGDRVYRYSRSWLHP